MWGIESLSGIFPSKLSMSTFWSGQLVSKHVWSMVMGFLLGVRRKTSEVWEVLACQNSGQAKHVWSRVMSFLLGQP